MEYAIDADQSVCVAVAIAVGTFEDRDPATLDPLANVIDTDALDTLFAQTGNGTHRQGGSVSFLYSHSLVTVHDNESVEISSVG